MTHPAIDILREWFNRAQSGCKFASYLASQDPRLAFWVHLEDVSAVDLADVEAHIDAAAADGDVALLVFPRISTDDEIVELAQHVQQDNRWSVRARSCPDDFGELGRRMLGLGIEFETRGGARSGVMGFAPSGLMPVTRRAPFVTLALWAGGRDNLFFRHSPAGTVNMADVPMDLDRESYDKMWSRSVADTRRRLQDPRHDSTWLRSVAFCLPRSLVEPRWPVELEQP